MLDVFRDVVVEKIGHIVNQMDCSNVLQVDEQLGVLWSRIIDDIDARIDECNILKRKRF